MKKLMSYIAVVALVLTFTACGNKDNEVVNNNPPVNSETNIENNNETENKENEASNEQVNNNEENKPAENKPDGDKLVENKPAENNKDNVSTSPACSHTKEYSASCSSNSWPWVATVPDASSRDSDWEAWPSPPG